MSEGANAEEQNVLLHIIKERGYEFFDNTPKTTMTVLLIEDLHNLGYKIVKQKEDVSNMLTVKEVLDILDDSDHLDDAKTLIRGTVS
jgi:hypothetical protein